MDAGFQQLADEEFPNVAEQSNVSPSASRRTSVLGRFLFVAGIGFMICAGALAFMLPAATGFAEAHVVKMFEQLTNDGGCDVKTAAIAAGMPETSTATDVAHLYLIGDGHAFSYVRLLGWLACGGLGIAGLVLSIAAWVLPGSPVEP